jgi:hypothetical protein
MPDEVTTYDWNQRRTRKTQPAAPVHVDPITPTNGDGQAYAQTALKRELETLTNTTEGSRNDQLNKSTFNLAQLVASGHLTEPDVRDHLTNAARQTGLQESEIQATIQSGLRAGTQHPRTLPPLQIQSQVAEVSVLQIAPTNSAPQTPDAPDTDTAPVERTSWWPEPVTWRAHNDAAEPQPTHLHRDDQHALFYAGKVNGLIGESESGKSWIMFHAIAQTIHAGQRVLLLDFEDTAAGAQDRLTLLGVPHHQQEQLLDYANPDESLGLAQSKDLAEALANQYAVIGVDGINAAMTLLGFDINSNNDANLLYHKLLNPLAATGACVITVDHVPKNSEARGKGGIGAQSKRSMMSGCCLAVEVIEPFGRGQSGILRLTVDKDRRGHVRGISGGGKFAGKAHLISDSDTVTITIDAPDLRPSDQRERFRPTTVMEHVTDALELLPAPATFRAVADAVKGREATVKEAIAVLVAEGFIRIEHGPRRSLQHHLVRPYRQVDDPKSDRFEAPETTTVPLSPTVSPLSPATVESDCLPYPLPLRGGETVNRPSGDTEKRRLSPESETIPDNQSSCNKCGELTPDDIIDKTGGYCRPCGRAMNGS